MKKLIILALSCALSPLATAGMPGMVGQYVSKDQCTLTIEALDHQKGYTDGMYRLSSDGTGACEWSGLGIAKRTFIDGGIASGASRGFVEIQWVYGPAGNQVDVSFFEPDGNLRLKESYSRM